MEKTTAQLLAEAVTTFNDHGYAKPIPEKAPCKEGQIRNAATGRCVKIKIEKEKTKKIPVKKSAPEKQPCKPGEERNANGRCVKMKELVEVEKKIAQIEKERKKHETAMKLLKEKEKKEKAKELLRELGEAKGG